MKRLISVAKNVQRPKRACLIDDNFEQLVFLKGNLQLLKENFKMPKAVVEEEFSYYKGIKY